MNLSSLFIEVDTTAGTDIEAASKDMVELSSRLSINVKANFNGCQMLAFPDSKAEKLVEFYHAWQRMQ